MSKDTSTNEETDIFARTWDEALRRCKSDLNEADAKLISELASPSKVAEDLRQKKAQADKPWLCRVVLEVTPVLEVLKHVTQCFLISMRPVTVEVTIIWGLLSLFIELSIRSENRWKQMSVILKRTRRFLTVFKKSVEKSENNQEMRQDLLDVFIALILFWAEASKHMREMNSEKVTSLFLRDKFEAAMTEMNAAIENLQLCAELRAAGLGDYRSVRQDQEIAALVPSDGHTTAKITYPYVHLPYDNQKRFVGREEELQKITSALSRDKTSEQRFFTIWGLGGVGKSQIALAFANRSKSIFDILLWINAETEESLLQSFTDVAIGLRLEGAASGQGLSNQGLVQSWLLLCGKKWLIVFDNVESIAMLKPFWPSCPGSILVTTRRAAIAQTARGGLETKLNIKELGVEDGRILFSRGMAWEDTKAVAESESDAIEQLLEHLGGLPLGICHITSLIHLKQSTVNGFLHRYTREVGNTKKISGIFTGPFDQDYNHGLETVWTLSFDLLREPSHHGSFMLLGMISLLSPDLIPTDLFINNDEAFVTVTSPDILYNENSFDEDKDMLLDTSLINIHHHRISIHRLVQIAFIHYLSQEELQTAFSQIALLLFAAFPKRDSNQCLFSKWPECEKVILQVIALAERFSLLRSVRTLVCSIEFVELLSTAARYLHETGQPKQCQRILEIARKVCPYEEKWFLGHIVHTAGSSKFEVNKLRASRLDLELALSIRKELVDQDPVGLAHTYNNLANLLSAEGEPEKALEHVAIGMDLLSRSVAASGSALIVMTLGTGRANYLLQKFEEAEKYFVLAENLIMKLMGPASHFTSHVPYLRGNLARKQGNLKEAQEHYQTALDTAQEKTDGPFLRAIYFKLGAAAADLEQIEDAKLHLHKAMALAQRYDDKGDIARISYKQATLATAEDKAEDPQGIENLLGVARSLKKKIEMGLELEEKERDEESEGAYDRLVCVYFR